MQQQLNGRRGLGARGAPGRRAPRCLASGAPCFGVCKPQCISRVSAPLKALQRYVCLQHRHCPRAPCKRRHSPPQPLHPRFACAVQPATYRTQRRWDPQSLAMCQHWCARGHPQHRPRLLTALAASQRHSASGVDAQHRLHAHEPSTSSSPPLLSRLPLHQPMHAAHLADLAHAGVIWG